ncbi:hypothetical protein SOVF_143770 [Spinacia oleracea]|nr:hypothetical protein SOVF_143770 [Spinacia oleracea]
MVAVWWAEMMTVLVEGGSRGWTGVAREVRCWSCWCRSEVAGESSWKMKVVVGRSRGGRIGVGMLMQQACDVV